MAQSYLIQAILAYTKGADSNYKQWLFQTFLDELSMVVKIVAWIIFVSICIGFVRIFFKRIEAGRNTGRDHGGGTDGMPHF